LHEWLGKLDLKEVTLGAFKMNTFPASFLGLPKMQTVSVNGAQIATPMSALPVAALSPDIRVLKLSGFGISGPLPSFRNSTLFEEIDLSHNNLTLGDAGAFDYCPCLLKVDLSDNSISAPVFHFTGSTNVEAVDISHNIIHGSIPPQWKELKSCKVARLAHNLIEEPLLPMQQMAELSVLDISHNRVAWEDVGTRSVDENGTVTFKVNIFWNWQRKVMPSSLTKGDYSHNLLRQPIIQPARPTDDWVGFNGPATYFPKMLQYDVSHNFLWGRISLVGLHFNFDVSHNEIACIDAINLNQGMCCDDSKLSGVTMLSVAMRHQRASALGFSIGETPAKSIDDALNSKVDFKSVACMPHYNAFEQVEVPIGSGRSPFSCPTWFVDDRTNDPLDHICSVLQERTIATQAGF
jgi:hypothetical protein